MEVRYSAFPSFCAAGRKLLPGRRLKQRSYLYLLSDTRRYLFQTLARQNPELSFRLFDILETVGPIPFVERIEKLTRCVRYAKRGFFDAIIALLDEIEATADLDFAMERLGSYTADVETEQQHRDQVAQQAAPSDSLDLLHSRLAEGQERGEELKEDDSADEIALKAKSWLHERSHLELDSIRDITEKEEEQELEEPPPIEQERLFPKGLYRRRPSPEKTEKENDKPAAVEAPEKRIHYRLDGFTLPKPESKPAAAEKADESPETVVIPTDNDRLQKKDSSGQKEPESLDLSTRFNLHTDHSYQIDKQEAQNGETGSRESSSSIGDGTDRMRIPPPLYRFKVKYRKLVSHHYPSPDPSKSSSLVVSQDCISRRNDRISQQEHFLNGSNFWSYFKKEDDRALNYRDATSLLINPDCISQRITNIKAENKHALERSPSEAETLRAFDDFFNLSTSTQLESEEEVWDEQAFDDDQSEEQKELDVLADVEEMLENRKQLFQQSYDLLKNRDGTLFDYMSGKISVDETDKRELDKWIRAQRSDITDIYRAFSEAVMQSEIKGMEDIQGLLRAKLQTEDLPSERVVFIFNEVKEKAELSTLQRQDLIRILKRQDYLSEDFSETDSTIAFSEAYSLYRDWDSDVESPDIQVRLEAMHHQSPVIPLKPVVREWYTMETPKITVRTSSEYKKKHTLSVYEKLTDWRKAQYLDEGSDEKVS